METEATDVAKVSRQRVAVPLPGARVRGLCSQGRPSREGGPGVVTRGGGAGRLCQGTGSTHEDLVLDKPATCELPSAAREGRWGGGCRMQGGVRGLGVMLSQASLFSAGC